MTVILKKILIQDQKVIYSYEAKFRREPLWARMIDEETAQVKAAGLNCYRYEFISRSGFAVSQRPVPDILQQLVFFFNK